MRQASRRKYHFIYKTTCTITGKWYIGLHSSDDLDDGYLGSGQMLSRSVKKYGKENHQREILEFCLNRLVLKVREAEIINEDLLSNPLCMNLIEGGSASEGHELSTRQKISVARKGVPKSDEFRSRLSAIRTGWRLSKTTKEKISAARKVMKNKEEFALRISKKMIGRTLSTEHRLRLSVAHKGKKHSDETRQKMSNSHRGISRSDEVKIKISEGRKRRYRQYAGE